MAKAWQFSRGKAWQRPPPPLLCLGVLPNLQDANVRASWCTNAMTKRLETGRWSRLKLALHAQVVTRYDFMCLTEMTQDASARLSSEAACMCKQIVERQTRMSAHQQADQPFPHPWSSSGKIHMPCNTPSWKQSYWGLPDSGLGHSSHEPRVCACSWGSRNNLNIWKTKKVFAGNTFVKCQTSYYPS